MGVRDFVLRDSSSASEADDLPYRLLFFGCVREGGPDRRVTLNCRDDTEAIQRAEHLADGRMMELWREGVYVKGWPAKGRR